MTEIESKSIKTKFSSLKPEQRLDLCNEERLGVLDHNLISSVVTRSNHKSFDSVSKFTTQEETLTNMDTASTQVKSHSKMVVKDGLLLPNAKRKNTTSKPVEEEPEIRLNIKIDFGNIKKLKSQNKNITRSIYKDDVPYKNDTFPNVR